MNLSTEYAAHPSRQASGLPQDEGEYVGIPNTKLFEVVRPQTIKSPHGTSNSPRPPASSKPPTPPHYQPHPEEAWGPVSKDGPLAPKHPPFPFQTDLQPSSGRACRRLKAEKRAPFGALLHSASEVRKDYSSSIRTGTKRTSPVGLASRSRAERRLSFFSLSISAMTSSGVSTVS